MDRVRADLATRPAATRSVVVAHAFVAGGAPSDSERDITVGGVAAVPAGIFDGVDYVALGHLHGSQTLTPASATPAPLAYSFSEADHRKTMWLVDLGPAGPDGAELDAERLDCPVPRPSPGSGAGSTTSSPTPRTPATKAPGSRPPSPTPYGPPTP